MSSEHIAAYAAGVAIHQFGVQGAREFYDELYASAVAAGDDYSYLAALNRTLSILERYEAATTQQQGENSNGNNS